LNLLKIEVGILILKPELPKDRIGEFKSTLYSLVGEVGSKVLAEFTVKLTVEKARKLWSKDVSRYPWAEEFYTHLSSTNIRLIVIEGSLVAREVKIQLRDLFKHYIDDLNKDNPNSFSRDLVHGCDEGQGLRELEILNGSEIGILSIEYFLKKYKEVE
jgi:hypothetical protein